MRRAHLGGGPVRALMQASGLRPGRARSALEPSFAELGCSGERLLHARGDRLRVGGIEEHRRSLADLGDGRHVRRCHGASARHRLERRKTEPLVQARVDETGRSPVETGKIGAREDAAPLDACRQGLERLEPLPSEDEPELGLSAPEEGERLEQARVVLVWPRSRGVEEEWLSLLVPWAEHRMVDGEGSHVDAVGLELEELERTRAYEGARHDDCVGASGGPVVREAPKRTTGRVEEGGKVVVLEVVQGDDRRQPRAGKGDRERVVENVGRGERRAERTRATDGDRHADDPGRAAASAHGLAHLDARQRVSCVGGTRRDDGDVLELADLSQRSHETPGVRLAPARDAGREGEQGDADAHPGDPTGPVVAPG